MAQAHCQNGALHKIASPGCVSWGLCIQTKKKSPVFLNLVNHLLISGHTFMVKDMAEELVASCELFFLLPQPNTVLSSVYSFINTPQTIAIVCLPQCVVLWLWQQEFQRQQQEALRRMQEQQAMQNIQVKCGVCEPVCSIIAVSVSHFLYHIPPCWPSGKASASWAKDPGFESHLRRDFFGVESYQWLKNWHYSGYPGRRLAL